MEEYKSDLEKKRIPPTVERVIFIILFWFLELDFLCHFYLTCQRCSLISEHLIREHKPFKRIDEVWFQIWADSNVYR